MLLYIRIVIQRTYIRDAETASVQGDAGSTDQTATEGPFVGICLSRAVGTTNAELRSDNSAYGEKRLNETKEDNEKEIKEQTLS